jgi:hypothetical protein
MSDAVETLKRWASGEHADDCGAIYVPLAECCCLPDLSDAIREVLDENERLRAEAKTNEEIHFEQGWKLKRATEKIEAALAIAERRLEKTRSWSDVRTHDERNALRELVKALRGGDDE